MYSDLDTLRRRVMVDEVQFLHNENAYRALARAAAEGLRLIASPARSTCRSRMMASNTRSKFKSGFLISKSPANSSR
jgi:thymidine kinase